MLSFGSNKLLHLPAKSCTEENLYISSGISNQHHTKAKCYFCPNHICLPRSMPQTILWLLLLFIPESWWCSSYDCVSYSFPCLKCHPSSSISDSMILLIQPTTLLYQSQLAKIDMTLCFFCMKVVFMLIQIIKILNHY